MRFKFFVLLLMGALLPVLVSAKTSTVTLAEVKAGDLIRNESQSAVYYMGKDGFRYVFPNEKTYFTWYANFDSVKWLRDVDLAKLQIGGNVAYKPGVKMIKIQSDPKVHAVSSNGALHWVKNEAMAKELYGDQWNKKIEDLPDSFFGTYRSSWDIATSEDVATYENMVATGGQTINEVKGLEEPIDISITDDAYSQVHVTVTDNQTIRWKNNGQHQHTVTSDTGAWSSGTLQPGDQFVLHIEQAGSYTYSCTYHPGMVGYIVVEEEFVWD